MKNKSHHFRIHSPEPHQIHTTSHKSTHIVMPKATRRCYIPQGEFGDERFGIHSAPSPAGPIGAQLSMLQLDDPGVPESSMTKDDEEEVIDFILNE